MACGRNPKRLLINDGEKDLISDLPSNVIDDVMDRLPLQEAAKLCILSRKWKLIWMSYPNLRLDAEFFRVVLSNKLFLCYEFNRILSNVLLSHNGPIPKFSLTIPKMDCPPMHGINAPHIVHVTKLLSALSSSNIMYMSSPEISPLIAHLSQNGIREISLDNHGSPRLKLQSQLFSCVELEKLKLCWFEVHIPQTFESFKSITRLEFVSVTLTGRTLESFISSCPSLETLVVKGIVDGGSLVINNAPNLKLIELEGTFTSICLEGCLGLTSVTIGCKEKSEKILAEHHEKAGGLVEFLSRSCKLQELNLRHKFYEFVGVPGLLGMISNTFDHLRKLQLANFPSRSILVVRCVIHIIQRCPNLEELKISFRMDREISSNPSVASQHLPPIESIRKLIQLIAKSPSKSFQRLRTVYLMSPTCSNNELSFIKFLLASAPILEKLYIPSSVDRVPTLASKLTKSLLQYSRASSKAEILFIP